MEAVNNLHAAANALLSPPSAVPQLLHPLSELEKCLAAMAQSPSYSAKITINLAIDALMSNKLVQNEDEDVKVSVAYCATEIMRITAPNPPCSDEQMKMLFPLIVSAFDYISDISSSSYLKRIGILKNFAKIRMWNLLLNLECDSLVLEMFKHFLANIRDNHPDAVFMHMGLIMIMSIEESDEIPLEIISTLLGYVRTRNENVLPVARKLAERVMENAYLKLTPYIRQAVLYAGYPLEAYSRVVANLYELQSLLVDHMHRKIVASPNNCLSLADKTDSSMLRWIGKKKRGKSAKIISRSDNLPRL